MGRAYFGHYVGSADYVFGVAGSSAVFKTAELAEYAAKQFYDLYMVFCFSIPE